MTMHAPNGPSDRGELSPRAFLFQVWRQALLARALGIAAELGIADLVADTPRSAAELAEATGAHAGALYRLLRMLASHGVFAEDDQGRFQNTPLAGALQTDRADSVRDALRLRWQDVAWDAYRQLPHAVMTGKTGFDQAFGMPRYEYMAAHPDVSAAFDANMAVVSQPENAAIARAYDFGQFSHVVDVGGGRGGLLAAVLRTYPKVHGVLYDQPHVVAEPTYLRNAGLLDRCEIIGGDFFQSAPQGYEVYMLKRILNDWDDGKCITVLQRCREAMAPDGRLLVMQGVLHPGNTPDPNKDLDLAMLALNHGRERTEAEFRTLYDEAGLRLTRIIPTPLPSMLSVVEGVRA